MLQRGEARLVVIAANASERAVEKVMALAKGKAVPVLWGPESVTMGERLGRPGPGLALGRGRRSGRD